MRRRSLLFLILACALLALLFVGPRLVEESEGDARTTGDASSAADAPALAGRPGQRPPAHSGSAAVRLEDLLARPTIDWTALGRLLREHEGPLSTEARTALLALLREDGSAHMAARALGASGDATVVKDLLALLDEPQLSRQSRIAVVQALAASPGPRDGTVVRELESRLTGDPAQDAWLLRGIGLRGGQAAVRAVVDYLVGSEDVTSIHPDAYQVLDVRGDPEATAELAAALARPVSPAVLATLLHLAAQPGASDLVEPLLALDRAEQTDAVRADLMRTLVAIGTPEALGPILDATADSGPRGLQALLALSTFRTGPPIVGDEFLRRWADADASPRPDAYRAALLTALGTMRHRAAAPVLAEAVAYDDARVRLAAIRGLGRLGAAAIDFVDLLQQRYRSGDVSTQVAVASALVQIGGEEARRFLHDLLANPDTPAPVRQVARSPMVAVERR